MINSQDTIRKYDGPFTTGQVLHFDISFVEPAHIRVVLDDVKLTLDSDYTVSPISSEGLYIGADITILADHPQAQVMEIIRYTPATQEQDYPENGPFESLDIERALDKLTMLAQEARSEFGGRFIEVSDKEPSEFKNMLPPADATERFVTVNNRRANLSAVSVNEMMSMFQTVREQYEDMQRMYQQIIDAHYVTEDQLHGVVSQLVTEDLRDKDVVTGDILDARLGGLSLTSKTAEEYREIEVKDESTIYFITGDN